MKKCGNCAWFVRIKSFDSGRNGLCEIDDCGTHSDRSAAKIKCNSHKPIKYSRKSISNKDKNDGQT